MTPKDFQDPLLAALGQLAEHQISVAVKVSDVVDRAFTILSLTPEKSLREKATWCGSQMLIPKGLVFSSRRGWWELTSTGLEAILKTTAGAVMQTTTSEWAKDKEGVSLPWENLKDSYHGDEYIAQLAQERTPCFGSFQAGHKVCGTCPLNASCRTQLLQVLANMGTGLEEADAEAALRQGVVLANKATTQKTNADLEKVLAELEAPTLKKQVATVDCVCAKCRSTIRAGETATFLLDRGATCVKCMPL